MWAKYWLIVGFLGLLICRGVSQDLKPTADTRTVLAPTGTLRVGLTWAIPALW